MEMPLVPLAGVRLVSAVACGKLASPRFPKASVATEVFGRKLASAHEGSGGRAGDLRLEGEFRGGLGRPDEVSLG